MNEKVAKFLEEEKRKNLIKLGLYDKIYAPDNIRTDEYPLSEWDNTGLIRKYYKEVPFEVTDEEYQQIQQIIKLRQKPKVLPTSKPDKNTIAKILTVIAWITFICGFIAGLILGDDKYGFSYTIAFIWWSSTFVSGILFLGFAEIIELLDTIRYYQYAVINDKNSNLL